MAIEVTSACHADARTDDQKEQKLAECLVIEPIKNPDKTIHNIDDKKEKSYQIAVESSRRQPGPPFPPSFSTDRDMKQDLKYNGRQCFKSTRKQVCSSWVLPSSLPKHTLWVRWRQIHNLPVYTSRFVYSVLARYGGIKFLASIATNSVIVVYDTVEIARRVIHSRPLGHGQCPLIVDWFFLPMSSYENALDEEKLQHVDPVKIIYSEEMLKRIQWDHMKKDVEAKIKEVEPFLTYKIDEFIP